VAEGARGKEAHGVVRRSVLRTAMGAATRLSECCWPFSGVVGLWGIGFFSYDLVPPRVQTYFMICFRGAELNGKITTWIGLLLRCFKTSGAFFGVYAFTYLTHYTGRKKAFAVSFVAAMLMTAYTFWNLRQLSDIFWMVPLMGFTQLSLFGGYAIYLPEFVSDAPAQHRDEASVTMSAGWWPPRASYVGPVVAGVFGGHPSR